uniref:Uncharacterized protein n=1 Tax=Panagrolaimus davidi TaxID=227884 RepID=A0A914NZ26_9BILA
MSNNITSLINFKAKFWFTDVLKISFPRLTPTKRSPKPPILMTDDSVKWMSTIVEKTYRFDTEYLLIAHTYIKLSDFKILTSSDVLDVLTLSNSAVFDSDGNDIPIDILLQRIPNVTSVNYHRPSNCPREIITNSTMINLTNQNSLRYFNIKDFALSPTFDIQLICTFIKKNAAKKLDSSKASFFFNLIYHSWEQKNQFTQAIKEMLQEWTSKETKPNVYIT